MKKLRGHLLIRCLWVGLWLAAGAACTRDQGGAPAAESVSPSTDAASHPDRDTQRSMDIESWIAEMNASGHWYDSAAVVERRRVAAQALGDIGDAAAVPVLTPALKDIHFDVRIAAAAALGKIGDRAAVPALRQAIKDEVPDVRRTAVEALGNIGDSVAVPALLAAVMDTHSDVRIAAVDALGMIGDPAAIAALAHIMNSRNSILANIMDSQNSTVMRAVAEALRKIAKKPAAVPILMKFLTANFPVGPLDGFLAVDDALRNITDPAALPAFVAGLQQEEASVFARRALAEGLGNIGDPAALSALVPLLGDPEHHALRVAVVQALGKIGDPAALPALMKVGSDANPEVRWALRGALGRIGRSSVPSLALVQQYLEDDDPDTRRTTAEALGAIADADAIPTLMHTLSGDIDAGVRLAAAEALGAIGDPAAIPALVHSLRDGSFGVRRASAEALGTLNDPGAVMALAGATETGGFAIWRGILADRRPNTELLTALRSLTSYWLLSPATWGLLLVIWAVPTLRHGSTVRLSTPSGLGLLTLILVLPVGWLCGCATWTQFLALLVGPAFLCAVLLTFFGRYCLDAQVQFAKASAVGLLLGIGATLCFEAIMVGSTSTMGVNSWPLAAVAGAGSVAGFRVRNDDVAPAIITGVVVGLGVAAIGWLFSSEFDVGFFTVLLAVLGAPALAFALTGTAESGELNLALVAIVLVVTMSCAGEIREPLVSKVAELGFAAIRAGLGAVLGASIVLAGLALVRAGVVAVTGAALGAGIVAVMSILYLPSDFISTLLPCIQRRSLSS